MSQALVSGFSQGYSPLQGTRFCAGEHLKDSSIVRVELMATTQKGPSIADVALCFFEHCPGKVDIPRTWTHLYGLMSESLRMQGRRQVERVSHASSGFTRKK